MWLYYQILMTAKMSKTEISAKILKGLSFKPNMKQIDEAVQTLACAIVFWHSSWILL